MRVHHGREVTEGGAVKLPTVLYRYYERRLTKFLTRELPADKLPAHIGMMVDGNRRWAKLAGAPTSHGHQAGADNILQFLDWCDDLGIRNVTLYMLSTDNMKRSTAELETLVSIIANLLDRLGENPSRRVHPVGALELLPDYLADKLCDLADRTHGAGGLVVNMAVGYGGRREIVDAIREHVRTEAAAGRSAEEIADALVIDDISRYLYTRGQPDPDLVIRTSGEQRLSGFMTWQSAYSEFYFCEALWPDFRKVDFLRALRDYARRQRRFGS
ncbi:undecaprenyl pyrophosphate synthetase [Zhihengliuella halotolerans]|uniref:Isoprenyl transferase n=1 Tax=Zhihengliuella halotolerans TaxID=370736 RepID=A0A4Q8AEH4_9MICC|nr:undecaprenyl pyrophosphate synthetase [Zhihengliuella halotolerans]